jgi:nicotinate-nucleotide adenylyltransferase
VNDSGGAQYIGLFGGTFDPVHQGHLALAGHVLERCRLDTLLFIPAPAPPHKRLPGASFSHRAAMLEAALTDCPDRQRVQLSLIEQELPAPSYTINTVEALSKRYGRQRFFLIIGADSLLDLPHWHRTAELLALVSLIIVKRDAVDVPIIDHALGALAPSFALDQRQGLWVGTGGVTAQYLADVQLPVSSSTIREELGHGRVPAMLPPAVLAYIKQHHLYGWELSP